MINEKYPFNKVFCIGLSRTGTVSLRNALQILGIDSIHLPIIMANSSLLVESKWQINRISIFLSKKLLKRRLVVFRNTYSKTNRLNLNTRIVDKYTGLADTPISRFYKELDHLYPGSKIILTVREMDSWLSSCERHFQEKFTGGRFDQINYDLYGSNVFDENLFREAYVKHVSGVMEYFKNRNEDLLILNVCGGEGFEKLCPFLELTNPQIPFPHRNKGIKNK